MTIKEIYFLYTEHYLADTDTRKIRKHKLSTTGKALQMLTCYDYQTACMLDEADLDLILVGDSLGNVVLGYDNTIKVSLNEMNPHTS